MKFAIRHQTIYGYSEPASLSQNELFLHPREIDRQRVVECRLDIHPTRRWPSIS